MVKPAVDVSKVVNRPPINDIDEKMVLEACTSPVRPAAPRTWLLKRICRMERQQICAFHQLRYRSFGTCLVGCGIGAGDHVLVTAYS